MDRREFLLRAGALSAWVLVNVNIGGCYDGDPVSTGDDLGERDIAAS